MAILGFIVGHRHNRGGSSSVAGKVGIASVGSVLLEYSGGWQPTKGGSPLTGLGLIQGLLLAPGGRAQQAGLLGGSFPVGEAGPIPSRVISQLKTLPHAEVVGFPDGQAYRYDLQGVPGYNGSVELFVIPGQAAAGNTALACYAGAGFAAEQRQCSQIIARLSLSGQAQLDLTPDAGYAHRLEVIVERLDGERLALRRELSHASTLASAAGLASVLGARLASAASAIATIEPPAVASLAEQSLVGSLQRARSAYDALGSAARSDNSSAYTAALGNLEAVEAGVNSALESFALLGYQKS